jgi:hypothetical protein
VQIHTVASRARPRAPRRILLELSLRYPTHHIKIIINSRQAVLAIISLYHAPGHNPCPSPTCSVALPNGSCFSSLHVPPVPYCMQVFPHNPMQVPGLLARIERAIHDGTRQAVMLASSQPTGSRTTGIEANLTLGVHAHALDIFIEGFPTYAPLLRKIKAEMEVTLNNAATCALECVALRRQLRDGKQARDSAVAYAYQQVRAQECI